MNKSNNSGFTLVELSIVIVIIGLIVASVTAGSSLVKQAKIQKSISELTNYHTAVNVFKLTYNFLPGDFPNAFAMWGVAANCTNDLAQTDNDGCNGNGDRRIDNPNMPGTTAEGEEQRLWQHLSLSKIFPNSLTGKSQTARYTPNVDVPAFYSDNSAKAIISFISSSLDTNPPGQNRISTNAMNVDGTTWNVGTLRGTTMLLIDKKLDDGVANTGKIQSPETRAKFINPPTNITCQTAGVYDLSTTEVACQLRSYF